MILFSRYPHVKSLIEHYSSELNKPQIALILKSGITSESEAEVFAIFIWEMLDQMAKDTKNRVEVLGGIDNSGMIPDIDYEVSLYLSEAGFEEVWDRVCDGS